MLWVQTMANSGDFTAVEHHVIHFAWKCRSFCTFLGWRPLLYYTFPLSLSFSFFLNLWEVKKHAAPRAVVSFELWEVPWDFSFAHVGGKASKLVKPCETGGIRRCWSNKQNYIEPHPFAAIKPGNVRLGLLVLSVWSWEIQPSHRHA